MVSQGDSIPPGVSPSSLSPEEHWGWWHAPAGRASGGAARPTVLVTPVVTATWGGTGRSWSQRGPPGPGAAALAVPFSRVAPRGFVSVEMFPRSISSLVGSMSIPWLWC